MRPINFAQLSSKKHKAVRRWLFINCILIGLLLGICAFFTAKQWNAYHAARNHAQNIAVSQPIQQKNNAQKIASQLKVIRSKLPAKASLESVSLSHATLEFKVTSDTQTLSALEKELSNEKIHLVSLEHKANRNIIATFTQSW